MIACWFHRRQIASALDLNRPLPEATTRHIAVCAKCKALYATEQALVTRLTHDAARGKVTAPPFLHGKIISSLRREEAAKSPGWGWGGQLVAMLAAIFVAGIALFTVLTSSPRNRESVDSFAGPVQPAPIGEANVPTALPLFTAQLEQPLEREMKSVANDTKNAIDMLAHSFLPEKYLASREE